MPILRPDPEPHREAMRSDSDTEISTEQALAIRENVRLRLIGDYHQHLMIAHYYQVVGNSPRAKLERAAALEIKMILHHIAHEDEPPRGLSIRLTEEGAIE